MTINTEVIRRLIRIKALADRAGTPEESRAARGMLERLLRKHGLSMSDLDVAGATGHVSYGEHGIDLGGPEHWRIELVTAIAVTHECRVLVSPGNPALMVGMPHDIIVAKDLYLNLSRQIPGLANTEDRYFERCTDIQSTIPGFDCYTYHADPWVWREDFLVGVCVGIFDQLRDSREWLDRESQRKQLRLDSGNASSPDADSDKPEQTSALAVRDEGDIDRFVDEKYEPECAKRPRRSFTHGYIRGYRVGRRLSLYQELEGDNEREEMDRDSADTPHRANQ